MKRIRISLDAFKKILIEGTEKNYKVNKGIGLDEKILDGYFDRNQGCMILFVDEETNLEETDIELEFKDVNRKKGE